MGNSVRSCWAAPNNEPSGVYPTLTTFSSELQKLSGDKLGEKEECEFKNLHNPTRRSKNSINTKSTRKLSEEWVQRFNLTTEDVTKHYALGGPIGFGKYGTVYKGHSLKDPEFTVAVKVIKIRKIKSNFESVMKEIQMLKQIAHPDIVKILEIYRDTKKLYLVMEYVRGEELFDYIVAREKLAESEARIIINQLVNIVKYLNSINICHRDLKPENIMIDPRTLKIKLLDFGLSSHFNEFKSLVSPVGTPYYVPPEVLRGNYNKECDMWSIGVITFKEKV